MKSSYNLHELLIDDQSKGSGVLDFRLSDVRNRPHPFPFHYSGHRPNMQELVKTCKNSILFELEVKHEIYL